MPPKPVAEASKAKMPDMLNQAILNDVLQYGVDKSRFAMTGKLLPKGVPKKLKDRHAHDTRILKDWVNFNHEQRPSYRTQPPRLGDPLAKPDDPLTSLFHVKRRGELDDPMEQFRSKLKETENDKKKNLKSEAEVTQAIETHHSTLHRLCNQSVETIARLIQALYIDKHRIRLEVIENITPQVLLDLGFSNGDISELMSNKPPLKAFKDRFSIAQKKVIEAGYQVVVGNGDKFEPQLTFGGDISDSEVEEQTTGRASAAKRKRKKDAADSDEDKSCGKSRRARKTKSKHGTQVKTEPVEDATSQSGAPEQPPKNASLCLNDTARHEGQAAKDVSQQAGQDAMGAYWERMADELNKKPTVSDYKAFFGRQWLPGWLTDMPREVKLRMVLGVCNFEKVSPPTTDLNNKVAQILENRARSGKWGLDMAPNEYTPQWVQENYTEIRAKVDELIEQKGLHRKKQQTGNAIRSSNETQDHQSTGDEVIGKDVDQGVEDTGVDQNSGAGDGFEDDKGGAEDGGPHGSRPANPWTTR
ncbi:hypothetical protein M409DRAFT_50702 [Zasmidium cellare ATCC 36951]|uniref:Uncharacterized protein n=1 Tax=Zasmidium cellare ATCC 36951 TaxID=1080233 RepID=A0A6A6D0R0_ZASCE|nr:uncharacterized protein M409DRAFT_50702 [Zasmidium cellare ATCC 36951]KAF2171236.1 hypothetical protein M409DRAFT_50702 [Zasmidium cellare ATCC 36951]